MTIQIPFKRNDWSSILDHDLGHLCRGRRIQMSGHSDLGIFNNLGASSIFTWVQADTASAACPSQPDNLEMISMTFAAVICDADDPLFSEYCVRPRVVFHNIISENNPDLCTFGALPPIHDICPLMMQNELLRPTSLLHRSPVSYF